MRKIPTLFVRDFDNNGHIVPIVTPGCKWVGKGLGVPTYKWDGTAVRYHHGVWYVRRTVKNITPDRYHKFMVDGTRRDHDGLPDLFKLEEYDSTTNKAFGWVPATGSDMEPYLVEALRNNGVYWIDGTYELVGPKINSNRHGLGKHYLRRHGSPIEDQVPTDFEGLREYLTTFNGEGIVWYRVDGSMAKIKRKDYGLE